METPHAKPSRLEKIVGRTLFGLTALVTLAALVFAEENWRGARGWQNYRRDMVAKGERFDAARLIPPKVPDDENFAMTPLFAPIFTLPPGDPRQPLRSATNSHGDGQFGSANDATNIDLERLFIRPYGSPSHPPGWNFGMATDLTVWATAMQGTNTAAPTAIITDPVQAASIIVDKMKPSEPMLTELQSATARRYCRFNINYEEWNKPDGYSAIIAHFTLSKWLLRFLNLHAEAEMVLGRTDRALADINVMFRVDDGLRDEPLLISQLVRLACVAGMLEPVSEGLAEQRWSEDQLRVLQERLQKTDLIASTVRALYGERDLCYNQSFDQGYMMPRGWNRLEQINVNRAFQEAVVPRIDLAAREIKPSVNHSIDLTWQQRHAELGFTSMLHHNIMAKMMVPVFFALPQKLAFAQSEVDMAMLACALERYRLAQGQYPDDLNALIPRFVTVLPHDIITGQPLKYRRTDNGRFILYSVGWNEKDDGGVVAANKAKPPRQDPLQGDWVWHYAEKP
jgi:hypothetical protein